jgi:hypothetical protein
MRTRPTRSPRSRSRTRLATLGVLAAAFALFSLSFAVQVPPASAQPAAQAIRCGNGSAPDYGFRYDLLQEHWTVNWEQYVSLRAVTEVDAILDQLDAESIAQTMILFQEPDQVGIRVNCAVHFLRYMKLGLLEGERKDNGFVFVIVVEPSRIDVHYAVGLGLPALTAPELTAVNRAAEDAYETTGSLDEALLSLVGEFDGVARSNYAPLPVAAATPIVVDVPELPSGPLGVLVLCGVLCLVTLMIVFLLWVAYSVAKSGIEIGPYGTDPFGSSGGGSWRGGGSWGRGGFGGGSWGGGRSGGFGGGGGASRGGGGSGRSGRGN